jgi:hypothetical protein
MYTIWTDYGSENWQPEDFDTAQECIDHIMKGNNGSGSNFRITEQRTIKIIELEGDN